MTGRVSPATRRPAAHTLLSLAVIAVALAGSLGYAGQALGYRLCANAVCQESPALGAPVALDVDGDGTPELIAQLAPVDPSGPGVGDLLRLDIVRLASAVPAHVFAEVVIDGATVRIGVDGRETTIPAQVHIVVSATSDASGETTAIETGWSDVPAGTRLTLAKDQRSMSILEPAGDFHGLLEITGNTEQREVRWKGSPIKILDAVVPGQVAFAGRLTDVPDAVTLTMHSTASSTSLDIRASANTLDIVGVASRGQTTYDIRATNLGWSTTIGHDHTTNRFTIDSAPPVGHLVVGTNLRLRSTCRTTVNDVDVSITVDAQAPNFELEGRGISELRLWKGCSTLKAEGAFTRVDGTLGSGSRAETTVCIGSRCRTRHDASFAYHRFVDQWDEHIGDCPGWRRHWRGWPKRVGQRDDGTFIFVSPTSLVDTQWIFFEPRDSLLSTDQIRLFVAKTEGALHCVDD